MRFTICAHLQHKKTMATTSNLFQEGQRNSSGGRRFRKFSQNDNQTRDGARVSASGVTATPSARPVLLLDVMDTIVRDPFYEDMPAYFNCTLKELFKVKHPTAWLDFEKGLIQDDEFRRSFFEDGREFDERGYQGLKQCMYEGYAWLDGMEDLLGGLLSAGYELNAFSNYPQWYNMIEEKLELSRYIEWSAVSCHTGFRKPDPDAYSAAAARAGAHVDNCIFVDDNLSNIEAATAIGMRAVHFQGAADLEARLREYGVER